MLFGNVNRTGHTADSCRNFNCDLHYVINRPASDYRQWYLTAASFINTFFAIKEPWKASAMEHNSLATQKLIRLLPATCCPATPQRDQTRNAKELFGFNRKRCTECFWISSRTNSFAFSPWTSLFYFFKKKKKKKKKNRCWSSYVKGASVSDWAKTVNLQYAGRYSKQHKHFHNVKMRLGSSTKLKTQPTVSQDIVSRWT